MNLLHIKSKALYHSVPVGRSGSHGGIAKLPFEAKLKKRSGLQIETRRSVRALYVPGGPGRSLA